MAKEEKLLQIKSKLNDRDFEDVYKIYLETERGKDRKISMIVCIVIAAICIFLFFLWHNITFIFYAGGAVVVWLLYMMVPSNRKFIAANKLQFGEWRVTSFYPHSISTMEILEDENETDEMDEDEIEEATTNISTVNLKAYENERAFLFADSKISVQFLYVPKRGLTEEEIAVIREFAEERCSGGYEALEMKSMIEDEESEETESETEGTDIVSAVCDRYYGAKKLHLYDSDGHRVRMDEDDEEYAEGSEENAEDAETEDAEAEVTEEAEEIAAEDAAEEEPEASEDE